MKKLLIAIIILFTSSAYSQACPGLVMDGIFPVSKSQNVVLCKKRYAIGFSVAQKAPMWTSEKLTADNVKASTIARKDDWRSDPEINPISQPQQKEFIGVSYDKGHMVPYEDLADDAQAADESFFLTNIVPQYFSQNRGVWKNIEGKVRKLALTKGPIYIVTGPIFTSTTPLTLKLGTPIPDSTYKVVFVPSTKEVYTLIVPNNATAKSSDLPKFNTTLQNLQKLNPSLNIYSKPLAFTSKILN